MSVKSKRRARKAASAQRRWIVLVGLIVVLAAMGGGVYLFTRRPAGPTAQAALDTGRAMGLAQAPVTIVEYGDFGCPTCKAWQQQGIKEQILADYAGKVRFVWRDFPVITAESPKAAEAGWCAADQGQFWTYHDLLYYEAPALSVSDLKAYAVQAGLNAQKFNQCLDSGQHQADVQNEMQDAYAHGFQATPSFLVNDKPLIGPPSYEQLAAAVDEALQAKK